MEGQDWMGRQGVMKGRDRLRGISRTIKRLINLSPGSEDFALRVKGRPLTLRCLKPNLKLAAVKRVT